MTVICFASVRGAPGTTTTALAVASWLEDSVLVEADPDGGVLALRYGLGREPGLTTLAASQVLDAQGLRAHAQALPGGTPAVVAPESSTQVTHVWRAAGTRLGPLLASSDSGHVIVDVGRVGASSPALPFVGAADIVVLVCRPVADEVIPAAERALALGREKPRVGIVLVGDRPYGPPDIEAQLGVTVFGVVADDPKGALALAGGRAGRSLGRSPLMRTSRALATALVEVGAPDDVEHASKSTEVPA